MRRSFAIAVLFASRLVLADNVFDQVAGRYPIYAVDGNEHVTGILEISNTAAKGIGFRMTELSQAPESDTPAEFFTPANATTVRKEGNHIVQEFKSDALSVRIEYLREHSQVVVQASRCPKNGNCLLSVVNNGNGIGEGSDASAFFSSIKGKYKIEKAGGLAPHGGVTADVSVSSDEINLTFPYCAEQGGSCDPGYIDMPVGDIKVSKRTIDRGTVATIVWDGKTFTWEERAGKIYFRNYQYETADGKIVTLSHELVRLP